MLTINVTLSNKRKYDITIRKGCKPGKVADLFCYEHGLDEDVRMEIKELVEECLLKYG